MSPGRWTTGRVLGAMAVLLLTAPLGAQFAADSNAGNQANSRVGSGGRNQIRTNVDGPANSLGNMIVTGNVTGGKEFRGSVPYRDPMEFRGRTSTEASDRLVRKSAGTANAKVGDQIYSAEPRAFYGDARMVRVPEGYASMGYGLGGYVAPPAGTAAQVQKDWAWQQVARRDTVFGRSSTSPGDQTIITASPLTGVRQWSADQAQSDPYLRSVTGVGATAGPQQHDEADLQRMREELFAPATPGSAAFDTAIEPALAAPAEVGSGQMQASVADTTGRQSTYQRVLLLPEQQSSQYAELRQRLEQLERDRASLTDEQAHSAFLEAQRLNQKEKPAPPKPASPSGESLPPKDAPDAPAAPHDVVAQAAERVRRPPADPQVAPLPIETLAEGVPAEGLRGLLSSAEEQLRQGQYSAALDSYDKAARVSPGNPMIDLGRAHAELAAGLYGRAEAHLRQALLADKALLMGRYDLRQFYGEERLQTVVTDLRSVAQAEPNDARPMLLLAYVAYNAGNEPAADDYLAQAELRMGLTDPLCQLLREQWGLGREPSDAATQPSAPEPKID